MTLARRAVAAGAVTAVAALTPFGAAWAAPQTPTTGQPGTTAGFNCTENAPVEPGNAASSPGSAFNETSGHAGTVYAGNGPGSTGHTNSTAAVSQYDTACRRLSSP